MAKIVTAPSEVLSKKAASVGGIDKNIKKILEDMKTALLSAIDPEGVGLAAPQIGIGLSIFMIKPTPKSTIKIFINPEIVEEKETGSIKKAKHTKLEGCLSLPNIWGEVRRSPSLTLSFLDQNGKKHIKAYKGFIATIIQHEIDHLNGILFTERVLEQNGTLYKSHKNKKGEDIFEEIEL